MQIIDNGDRRLKIWRNGDDSVGVTIETRASIQSYECFGFRINAEQVGQLVVFFGDDQNEYQNCRETGFGEQEWEIISETISATA